MNFLFSSLKYPEHDGSIFKEDGENIIRGYISRTHWFVLIDYVHFFIGNTLFMKFCHSQEGHKFLDFYKAVSIFYSIRFQIIDFEHIDSASDRIFEAKRIYDTYIMKELLVTTNVWYTLTVTV